MQKYYKIKLKIENIMTVEKFESEIEVLQRFCEYYCKEKHTNILKKDISIQYKDKTFYQTLNLCETCLDTIFYSYEKLQSCPHEEKPRCRKCPSPCYERHRWKNMVTIMKFSAINLGLSKLRKKVSKFFTK